MPEALVIITPGFPENDADSTCVPPQQTFVRMLQQLYPHRQLIVLSLVYPFFSGEYRWHNVRVIAFGKPGAGRLYRKAVYFRAWKILRQLHCEYELQGILAFWLGPAAWLAYRFGRHAGLPVYTWLLGQDAREGNRYVQKINPKAATLIALSDAVADEFQKHYGIRPARVVPPGIDPDLFGIGSAEKDIDILGVGSLIPLKQFDVFVSLVLKLKARYPVVRAQICGDGPERTMLERRARQHGLTAADLYFTGRLSHSDVLETMQRCRILLHPSEYEGFGVVCLEALYAGASVVSFVRPMHAPVEGWFPVADVDKMEEQLALLLDGGVPAQIPRLPFRLEDSARAINQFFDSSMARDPRTDSYLPAPATDLSPASGNKTAAIS